MAQVLKFRSVEDLQKQIDAYFKRCDRYQKPYTIAGLAYSLKTNRSTLLNYEKSKGYEKYFDTIKNAKARVEAFVEEALFTGKATGPIFNLKNNFAEWKEKSEQDINISGNLTDKLAKALKAKNANG